jgi:hypothetical protein
VLEAIVLLTAGVGVGRLWAWLKAATQVVDCPRCAVEDRKQETLMEISALKRMGQEQMRQAATGERQQRQDTPRRYGAEDDWPWPTGRFGGQ